jgi:hypothetical protein
MMTAAKITAMPAKTVMISAAPAESMRILPDG